MNHAGSGTCRGTVHAVHDAVVDIRFEPEWLPIPTSLLLSTGDETATPAHLRVVAQLDSETVRALRSPACVPITVGSAVTTLADPGPDEPLDLATLHRALDQLAPRAAESHGLIATGIKVIDVFCPLQAGMRVALCGAALNVGAFVVMRELTQRLQGHAQTLSLFTTLPASDADAWRAMREEWAHAVILGSEVTAFQILTSSYDPTPFTQATAWDAVLGFSTALAEAHLRPAIDPLHSLGCSAAISRSPSTSPKRSAGDPMSASTAGMPSQIARPSLLDVTTTSIRRRCISRVVHRCFEAWC